MITIKNFITKAWYLGFFLFLLGCLPFLFDSEVVDPGSGNSQVVDRNGNTFPLSSRQGFLLYLSQTILDNRYYWYDDYTRVSYLDPKYYDTAVYPTKLQAANGFLADSRNSIDRWSQVIPLSNDPNARAGSRGSIVNDEIDGRVANKTAIFSTLGYFFGFRYFMETQGSELLMHIVYVIPGSAAEKSGMERGDRIVSYKATDDEIEGLPLQGSLSNLGEKIDTTLIANRDYFQRTIAYSGSGEFELKEGDGTIKKINMTRTLAESHFFLNINKESEVLAQRYKDTIIEVKDDAGNSEKVGYSIYTGFDEESVPDIVNMFYYWRINNIKKVVLDLRYNSGGRLDVAQLIASLLLKDKVNQIFTKLDFRSINSLSSDSDVRYISPSSGFVDSHFCSASCGIPQERLESLGVEKVYFLVTKESASASELIISGLSPYLDITVIGENTHGKGYGQQPETSPDRYYQFSIINFRFYNSKNEGVEANGIAPSAGFEIAEDFSQNWGVGENLLDLALKDIKANIPATGAKGRALRLAQNPLYQEVKVNPPNEDIEFPYDNKFQ